MSLRAPKSSTRKFFYWQALCHDKELATTEDDLISSKFDALPIDQQTYTSFYPYVTKSEKRNYLAVQNKLLLLLSTMIWIYPNQTPKKLQSNGFNFTEIPNTRHMTALKTLGLIKRSQNLKRDYCKIQRTPRI